MREYGLFQGDKLIARGTRREIAQATGMTEGQLRACGYNKDGELLLAFMDMKIDCFAYTGKTGELCRALYVDCCDWEKCKFYKPKF